MMALWAICAAAQPPQHLQPRILDNGFRLMPTNQQFKVQNEDSGNNIHHKSKPNKSGGTGGTIGHQVDFVLDYNENQRPYIIRLISPDQYLDNFRCNVFELVEGSNVLTIPTGTYDIIIVFEQSDPSMPGFTERLLHVVREQVIINQDMQLQFSADEAKNHIDFRKLTIDGEPVCTDLMATDDYANWTLIESGNTDEMYVTSILYHKDYGQISNFRGNSGVRIYGSNIDSDNFFDFFINDVSDQYVFESYQVALKNDKVFTSNCRVEGASGDTIVSNDPTKFDPYEFFEDNIVNPINPSEQLASSFVIGFIDKENDYSPGQIKIYGKIPIRKYYISAEETDMIVPFIETSGGLVREFVNDWGQDDWEFMPITLSMPIVKENGQIIYANNGTYTHSDWDYTSTHFLVPYFARYLTENGDVEEYPKMWPTHTVFSHPIKQQKDAIGDCCPLLISILAQYEVYDQKHLDYLFEYLGQYGEITYSSALNADLEIIYNGITLYSGKGPISAALEEMLNGEIDNTITHEGFFVDGLPGSNKAHLKYTAGAEDQNPPTTTMLHFKDSNEDVTTRFAKAADATLEFSAGDFNVGFNPINVSYMDRYAPESVEVSYSPYGEDNWSELPVEEVPEYYWPVMGWFYSGSLAGVTGEALNGWFDLKIRLTDAAGNWQEQVLSPAFRIDDLAYSSVANIGSDNAHEVARYNLAGQRVDTNTPGVAIVKMSDGTAHKVIVP